MSWGIWVLVALLASGLGYLGAQVALVRNGRTGLHRKEPAAPAREAVFTLEHLDGQTWSLINTGNAAARVVSVFPLADGIEQWPPQPPPDAPSTATSERLPTLEPGDSLSVWLSRHDRGQQVLVGWTSEANVRMGPVTLDVPEPDGAQPRS